LFNAGVRAAKVAKHVTAAANEFKVVVLHLKAFFILKPSLTFSGAHG